jgi:hypothetical protein
VNSSGSPKAVVLHLDGVLYDVSESLPIRILLLTFLVAIENLSLLAVVPVTVDTVPDDSAELARLAA